MKRVFLLVAIICAAYSVRGNDAFEQGDWVIGAAVAIGEHYASDANDSKTPVIALLGEYCVVGDSYGALGVGLKVGYSSYATAVGQNASVDVGNAFFLGRINWHYQFLPRLDTYVGVALGARIRSLENNILPDNRTAKFAWEANVGARYYLAPRFGLFAEVGYGIAYLNLGLVVKIVDFE